MDIYEWDSIQRVFEELNKNCTYLILRNYEDIEEGRILVKGHDDIDLLCTDRDIKKVIEYMHAFPRFKKDNSVFYLIHLQGQNIKVDIRHTGDGYYDLKWQEAMLEKRKLHSFGFYIMDEENYYYSLAYHGLFQKRVFAEDYRERLAKMAAAMGFGASSVPSDHIDRLNTFMRKHEYNYTDPTDPTVYINFTGLPSDLVHKNYGRRLRRFFRRVVNKIIAITKTILERYQWAKNYT
jgi:hypothetical protein